MKRILSTLLLTAMILCVSCGKETVSIGTDTEQSANTTSISSDTTSENLDPQIPAFDYGGYEFRILTSDIAENEMAYHEVFSEGENGEVVNDAVYKRNVAINEKYNVKIIGEYTGLFDFSNFTKSVLANDDVYDVVLLNIKTAVTSATSGYLKEINDIPYLDFSKPWWRENSVTESSIMTRSYFAVGDINLASYESTPVIFFNKQMTEANNITDLYEVVDRGEWTYDKMLEYCSDVGSDLDGNSVYDENDSYGLALNSFSVFTFTYGGGFRVIEKDNIVLPYINISERLLSFLQKHIQTCAENNSILNGDTIAKGDIIEGVKIRQTAFRENRVLFYNEMLTMASMLRNMETDFGVLPMPKSDETQKTYYSFFHNTNSSTVTIPVTNSDIDRTGRIVEDMLYQSHMLVRPAYFEKTVYAKAMRDEESERMLDLILGNIIFDDALDPGILDAIRPLFNKANTNIASALESKMPKLQDALDKTVSAFAEK